MKKIALHIICYILLLTSCQNGISQEFKGEQLQSEDSIKSLLPEPIGYVNDFEKILSNDETNALNSLIDSIKNANGAQFSIISWDTASMPKMNFELLNLATANKWGVGDKYKHNGILIGICKNLRKITIQNGFGIAKVYSNEETKNIIDQTMKPYFKLGQFYEGLKAGMLKMTEELKGRI